MYLVQKYGGNYLKNNDDLTKIADHIANHREELGDLVLVTAAMHEIATEMLERAEEFRDGIGKPELDALFSASEYQTAALMASALEQRGVPARVIDYIQGQSLTPLEIESGKHELILTDINKALEQNIIPVVAGFQGIGDYEMSDRFGRYGSAATAVAIAGALGCECELYGNTKRVYIVDPRVTEDRKKFDEISYEEAMELTMLGDGDLEAEAIELASMLDVKLYVGPALKEDHSGGTYIVSRKNIVVEEAAVSGISTFDDVVIYTIKGIPNQGEEIAPTSEEVEGFNRYIENYKRGLAIEMSAVQNKN